jgi:hypothetical protein
MSTAQIDPHEPIRSLSCLLGVPEAVERDGLLSVTIDGRLPMTAALGARSGTLDVCFELADVTSLDDLGLLGAMDEIARWRCTTTPARLEVLDGRLLATWSPEQGAGERLVADLGDLVATCAAIQDMFDTRRRLCPAA